VVGVGFGPANLALAIAIEEHNRRQPARPPISAAFAERQPSFGWHRGMLLDGTTMQVSFLKDLAMMRDPTSDFGFLSYLHARGRLVDFINHKTLFPSRVEFHDYLEWSAGRLDGFVTYGQEVTGLRPVRGDDGEIGCLDVLVRPPDRAAGEGVQVFRRARNVVVGVGLRPHLPDGVRAGARVWHNHDLLSRLEALPALRHQRFAVVGSGQSAAEVVDHLHTRFPQAQVCAVFTRYGYSPADDSSFANRIFDPEAVDDFFTAPGRVKQMLLDYHRNTNYSVVDLELIQELYRRSYQEKVRGVDRLRMLNASRVDGLAQDADGARLRVEFLPTGAVTELDCDAVVFATGYRPVDPAGVLGELVAECELDKTGWPRVGRDHRAVTRSGMACGIYLQGGTEQSHGLSATLLSNAAVRAGEVLDSILARSLVSPPVPKARPAALGEVRL
jgi:L-ornithine N5-oxygenase